MDKKKVAIIAIVLFLCLGTFVFAGPSESLKTEGDTIKDDKNSTNNSGNNGYNNNSENNDDIGNIPGNSDDNIDNNPTIDNEDTNNDNNQSSSNNSNNGGNNSSNNQGGNNSSASPGNSGSTNGSTGNNTKPDDSIPIKPNENPYQNIKNILNELNNKIEAAKNKDDIVLATIFRDSNNLIEQINNLSNINEQQELLNMLNNINKILNDHTSPIINGVTNNAIIQSASLSIIDENIKTILLNGVPVTLEDLKNIKQDGKYNIIVYDKAYNESSISFTIDNLAPELTINYSTTVLTNKDVIVTIISNEEIKYLAGWTLSSDQKTLTKTVSSNISETITISDLAGNEKQVTYSVKNIDKTSPVLNITNKDITDGVVVTISSNKALQPLNGWTLAPDKLSLTKTFTENTTAVVQVYDEAGNMTIANIEVDSIPKPVLKVEITKSTEEITNKDIEVIITANRKIKAVPGWIISADELSISKIYTENIDADAITIYDAEDETSFIEEIISITNIDKKVPEYIISTEANSDGTVTIRITTNEKIKEVEGWTLSSDQKELIKKFNLNESGTVTISDLAGNEVNISYIASLDFEIPAGIVVSTSNDGNRTNLDVTVTITSNKEIEPIPGWTLSSDSKVLTKVFSENTSGFVFLTYTNGNTVYVGYKVVNIDKTIPEVLNDNIKYNPSTPTNGEVVVEITTSKPILTPPNGWVMVPGTDAKVFRKTFTDNVTNEEVILRDLFGNVGKALITVNNIDRNAPKILKVTTSNEDGKITTNNVTVAITANKELQEIGDNWVLSADKLSISKVFYENIAAGEVLISDLAGNTTTAYYTIKGIDNEVTGITVKTSNDNDRTNRDVIVTISAEEELIAPTDGWVLSADKLSISKTFESDTSGVVLVTDLYGNSKEVPYRVVNINKVIPEVDSNNIKYSFDENNNLVVEIITSKPILTPPNGWIMIAGTNATKFIKTYTESTIDEDVVLRDLYGNVGHVNINISKIIVAKNTGSLNILATEITNTMLEIIK
jgi:pterin-4a-carbinolamine dehydratase